MVFHKLVQFSKCEKQKLTILAVLVQLRSVKIGFPKLDNVTFEAKLLYNFWRVYQRLSSLVQLGKSKQSILVQSFGTWQVNKKGFP